MAMAEEKLPLASSSWLGGSVARWLMMVYAILIVAGVIVFHLPGAMVTGNEMSWERSVFTVVNAATLTGFQQAVALDEYGSSGQICVITLTVAGAAHEPDRRQLGGETGTETPGNSDGPGLIWTSLFTFIFCVGVGTSLLLEPTRGLLDSATQACSAFANSGLYLGKLPGVTDWRTHLPLLPLALVGGLSIPVLQELVDFVFRRQKLSKHSVIVLTWLAGIYLFGVLVLSPWGLRGSDGGLDWKTTLATGSTLSINSRSCGLPLTSPAVVSRAAQWILIVLMSIGAAPGGTAGGLGVTTLYQAWRAIRRSLRQETGVRIGGIAITWIVRLRGNRVSRSGGAARRAFRKWPGIGCCFWRRAQFPTRGCRMSRWC